ncbi:MAG: ACR3 family arsenite efflux transporter [Atopobiaceae bacterium]|jgi:ACR3 family arsenite transporter
MAVRETSASIGSFEKYLSVWVLACMVLGVVLSQAFPALPLILSSMELFGQNIPIAVLIWVMIFPMMLKIDFQAIKNVGKHPLGILISSCASWVIKPFLMLGLSTLFLRGIFVGIIGPSLAQQYVTGAVLLGAAPCTAMVFVWSRLAGGDPAHTLVQVTVNDLLILVLFVPLVSLLLGVNDVQVPWSTLAFSVLLFVAVPLLAGIIVRRRVIRVHGEQWLDTNLLPHFDGITTAGLLLTLVLIFTSQGDTLVEHPIHVVLIAVPLILQNVISTAITYTACRWAHLRYEVYAPASLIAASDFFELSVAVAVSLFGASSPVALACTVGVLTEVPVMLALVRAIKSTRTQLQ